MQEYLQRSVCVCLPCSSSVGCSSEIFESNNHDPLSSECMAKRHLFNLAIYSHNLES